MTQNTKICIELTFDKKISHSQQIKVKNFWKFMTETRPFEPYRIISGTIVKIVRYTLCFILLAN